MTAIDRAELRRVAEAATPGVWVAWGNSIAYDTGHCGGGGCDVGYGHEPGCSLDRLGEASEPDAAHIAAFDPPTVLALLDALDAAEDKYAGLREAVGRVADRLDTSAKASRNDVGRDHMASAELLAAYAIALRNLLADEAGR
ncbi:ead/Ea22-like family protein [Nocardioides sp. YIM 152315]|uniref:ead/Ea22-like family protein n=1 Tax=Nocardioides sp. YIM 152315 TaxID=3031760 RepID=UPI0023DC85BD|nr:ead/Ea22-like family protein [Nocardioides sp. YIM 152315]MDF1603379.1 ead/Ea22-like family protein [Nocardioides sp. YIM 152315]